MKATQSQKRIISQAMVALASNKIVTVDGVRVRAIQFLDGEIEVDWERPEQEPFWTVIQPNFMSDNNGNLEIKTY